MTLEEAINEQIDGYIYVGAFIGWIWIGEKIDAVAGIGGADKWLLERKMLTKKKYESELKIMYRRKNRIESMLIDTPDDATLRKRNEWYRATIEKQEKCIKDMNEQITKYIPMLKREVLKSYPRTSDREREGTAYIVKGSEQSPYWCYEQQYNAKEQRANGRQEDV